MAQKRKLKLTESSDMAFLKSNLAVSIKITAYPSSHNPILWNQSKDTTTNI
jgi:hypothetical protein